MRTTVPEATTPLSDIRQHSRCRTINLDELARLLGVARSTIYAEAKSGTVAGIKIIKVRGRLLVPVTAVERLLDGSEPDAA